MSIRRATAVDVLITDPGTMATQDEVIAVLLRYTKADATRVTDVASRILAGSKVMFEYHSEQTAAALAEELRSIGMTVEIQK